MTVVLNSLNIVILKLREQIYCSFLISNWTNLKFRQALKMRSVTVLRYIMLALQVRYILLNVNA